jgi:hypothetical protein
MGPSYRPIDAQPFGESLQYISNFILEKLQLETVTCRVVCVLRRENRGTVLHVWNACDTTSALRDQLGSYESIY